MTSSGSAPRTVSAAFCAMLLALSVAGVVEAEGEPTNSFPNPYRTIAKWAKLPEGRPWGSTVGVTVERNGRIWVAVRCGVSCCADVDISASMELGSLG